MANIFTWNNMKRGSKVWIWENRSFAVLIIGITASFVFAVQLGVGNGIAWLLLILIFITGTCILVILVLKRIWFLGNKKDQLSYRDSIDERWPDI